MIYKLINYRPDYRAYENDKYREEEGQQPHQINHECVIVFHLYFLHICRKTLHIPYTQELDY